MPFDLPDDLKKKEAELRVFLDAEIAPLAAELDAKGPLSHADNVAFFKKLVPMGFIKSYSPKDVGGDDVTYLERAVMAKELGRAWNALSITVDTHAGVIEMIARHGTDDHKRKWAEPGVRGEIIGCDMVSEPCGGSDQTGFTTTAILDGDHYVVNGQKMWQTNGTQADVGILTAISDPEAYAKDPRTGLISLIVDRHESPWKVTDLPFVGAKAGNTALMEFDNVRVPKENLLHNAEEGYRRQLLARAWFRVWVASQGLGLMEAVRDDAIAYAKERHSFGKPIAGHQLVQELIADIAINADIQKLLIYRAASLMDKGERCDVEQSMAKAFYGDHAVDTAYKGIQVLGARGLTTDLGFRMERLFRDSALGGTGEGTTQILKLIIGRRLTGVNAFV